MRLMLTLGSAWVALGGLAPQIQILCLDYVQFICRSLTRGTPTQCGVLSGSQRGIIERKLKIDSLYYCEIILCSWDGAYGTFDDLGGSGGVPEPRSMSQSNRSGGKV